MVVGYDAAIVVVVVGLVVDVVLVLVAVCFVLASDEHTPSSTIPELSLTILSCTYRRDSVTARGGFDIWLFDALLAGP